MAAETLDILVRMKDFATAELRKLEGQVAHTSKAGTVGFGLFEGAIGRAKKMLLGFGATMATYFTARQILGAISRTADWADNLDELSQQVGVSTEALSELEYVALKNGAAMADLETGFRMAQKGLGEFARTGTGPAAKAIEMLAGDTQMLIREGASLEDLLPKISRDLKGLGDADRVLLATQLFGRGGGKLIPTLISDLEAGRQAAKDLNVTLSGESAAAAGEYKDALQDVRAALSGIGREAILQLLPELTRGFKDLTGWVRENRESLLLTARTAAEALGVFAQIGAWAARAGLNVLKVTGGLVQDWKSILSMTREAQQLYESEAIKKYVDEHMRLSGALKEQAKASEQIADAQARMPNYGALARSLAAASREQREGNAAAGYAAQTRIAAGIEPSGTVAWQESIVDAIERQGTAEEEVAEARRNRNLEEVRQRQDAHAASLQQRADLQAELQQWREIDDFGAGARAKFRELAREAQQFGAMAARAIDGIGGAVSYGLVDSLIAIQHEAGRTSEAIKAMATSILEDIQRIILQEAISAGVKAIFGSLGGWLTGGASTAIGVGSSVFGGVSKMNTGFMPQRALGGPVFQDGPHWLHKGEQVLPPDEARGYRGAAPVSLVVNVTPSGADLRGSSGDIDRRGRALGIAVASEIRQSRVLQEAIRGVR